MIAFEMNIASDIEISFSDTNGYRNQTVTIPIFHY